MLSGKLGRDISMVFLMSFKTTLVISFKPPTDLRLNVFNRLDYALELELLEKLDEQLLELDEQLLELEELSVQPV